MNFNLCLIVLGLAAGMLWQRKAAKNAVFEKIKTFLATSVFNFLLPLLVLIEVSSMDLGEWWLFAYGAIFVFILYGAGLIITGDKNKAALLATAEGGTIGFMFYNTMKLEPLSRFFLIDMLGNGGALFSFIYWRISGVFKFRDFAVKNRLMLALWAGLALNIIATGFLGQLRLKNFFVLSEFCAWTGLLITMLISVIVGTEIRFKLSREIFFSRFFCLFWLVRLIGLTASLTLALPFAMTILFILPPSFLLPVIYTNQQGPENEYAANFIAACLPVTFVIFFIMNLK